MWGAGECRNAGHAKASMGAMRNNVTIMHFLCDLNAWTLFQNCALAQVSSLCSSLILFRVERRERWRDGEGRCAGKSSVVEEWGMKRMPSARGWQDVQKQVNGYMGSDRLKDSWHCQWLVYLDSKVWKETEAGAGEGGVNQRRERQLYVPLLSPSYWINERRET